MRDDSGARAQFFAWSPVGLGHWIESRITVTMITNSLIAEKAAIAGFLEGQSMDDCYSMQPAGRNQVKKTPAEAVFGWWEKARFQGCVIRRCN